MECVTRCRPDDAVTVASDQLLKAGDRLAAIRNATLGSERTSMER